MRKSGDYRGLDPDRLILESLSILTHPIPWLGDHYIIPTHPTNPSARWPTMLQSIKRRVFFIEVE